MSIYTHHINADLFADFPDAQLKRFMRGEAVLCTDRAGELHIVSRPIATLTPGLLAVCRVVGKPADLDEAMLAWRDVSINVHSDGVAFCCRDPLGGEFDCMSVSADLPGRYADPAAVLGLIRSRQQAHPGIAVVALVRWAGRPDGAIGWEYERDEEVA